MHYFKNILILEEELEFLKKIIFIYDGGPTVVTAPYLLEELFALFNKNISDYAKNVRYTFGIDLFLRTAHHLITPEVLL